MSINIKSENPLIKIYEKCPRSYFLIGNASFGKTTLLQHFAEELHGMKIENSDGTTQTLIVIYLPMYDVNLLPTGDVEKGPILELLKKKKVLNQVIERSGIIEMINNDISYRYIFLLDGINEIQERHLEVGNIYKTIGREIINLLDYANVDIIATARTERILFDDSENRSKLRELLKSIKLIGMCQDDGTMNPKIDKEKVSRYLEVDKSYISDDLWELFESPMLLSYYKKILEQAAKDSSEETKLVLEDVKKIHCKTDLLDCYYNLDITKGNDEIFVNEWDDIRREHLLKWILPGIAFYVEYAMLSVNQDKEVEIADLKEVFDKVYVQFKEYDTNMPKDKENLWNGLMRLQICDENGKFIHDIIREYWASKGLFIRLYHSHKDEENKLFIDNLAYNLERRNGRFEIVRQTRHIGLIEVIYEITRNKSYGKYDFLCKQYAMARKGTNLAEIVDYRVIYELFFHYMSMLDDLNERDKAAEVGWFTYDGISDDKRKEVFDSYYKDYNAYRLANMLNDMGYSTNNSDIVKEHNPDNPEGNPDALSLLMESRQILEFLMEDESILTDEEIEKYKVLLGKNINNVGAYYYGCEQYEKALEKHIEALEYRKNLGINLTASYRVIASDYYKLGLECVSKGDDLKGLLHFQKAYECFKKYLGYLVQRNSDQQLKFSEIESDKYNKIDRIQVINVLGTQIELLRLSEKIHSENVEIEELLYEMSCELQYCNNLINSNSRRRMTDTIEKLDEKKNDIKKMISNPFFNSFNTLSINKLCEV